MSQGGSPLAHPARLKRPERWPEDDAGGRVPDVLLSGHHAEIRRWRLKQALGRTWLRRPELLQARGMSDEEKQLLAEYQNEHTGK